MNRKSLLTSSIVIAVIAGFTVNELVKRPPVRRGRPGLNDRPAVESGNDAVASIPKVDLNLVVASAEAASDSGWSRFRGPNGVGHSDDQSIPTVWSDGQNVRWKTKLPGPGSSSPVLTDQFVFITCYSGYGEERNSGSLEQLKRHLVCVSRTDGSIVWTRTFDAVLPEDRYEGMGVPEHGYATNSPVTDGETVFAFLGKAGVYAFDLAGAEKWHVSVGVESGNRGWGTASSLLLYGNLVIVNASEESQSIMALDKATGAEVWKSQAATLELSYGTPAIMRVDDTREDLVLAVPGEVWGMNPNTGKLVWYAETSMTDNLSPSVIIDNDRIYAFGGYRSSGSIAMRGGGRGDVTDSHVLWTSRNSSYVATPVLLNERLHWIDDRGMYFCANANDGEWTTRSRVPGIASGERPVYASPIAIAGKVYAQTRTSGLFVIEPADELQVISQNKFNSDSSVFNATPAVDKGQLFLRSYQSLYCIGQ